MRIKSHNSDNALRALWNMVSFIETRTRECIQMQHNATSILYISSLIISPYVEYNNERLLDKIRSLVSMSPSNFICLIRTTEPSYFPENMRKC